jgi:hypothetical protein
MLLYDCAEDFDAREEVEAAIRRFESATPVNFRRRNGEQNFVRFVPQMTRPYLARMSPIGKTGFSLSSGWTPPPGLLDLARTRPRLRPGRDGFFVGPFS